MLGQQAAGEHRQRATLRGGSPRRGRATSPTAHPAHGAQPVRPKSPRSTNLSRSSSCEDTRTLSSLEDGVRGDLVGLIASQRPDLCIFVKDRASGPDAMVEFVRRVVEMHLIESSWPPET